MGRKVRRDSYGRQASSNAQVRKNHVRFVDKKQGPKDERFFTGTTIGNVAKAMDIESTDVVTITNNAISFGHGRGNAMELAFAKAAIR